MLLQNYAPNSVESALSFAPNHMKRDLLCEWVPAKTWQGCSECGDVPWDGSGLLTASNMCPTSGPNLMCKQQRTEKNSVMIFPTKQETNEEHISRAERGPSMIQEEYEIDDAGNAPVVAPDTCNRDLGGANASILISRRLDDDYDDGCSQDTCSAIADSNSESQFVSIDREFKADSFPSSQSFKEVSSVTSKSGSNGITESLNCDILELEADKGLSIRNLCWPVRSTASTEILEISNVSGCTQSCKLCGNSGNTLNMLLCDHCEEAFHASCCNPRVKILPMDEWFCHCCSKLNCKVSQETYFLKSPSISWRSGTSRFGMGPIAIMLKYPEPYRSRVRIGKSFQAKVPEWSDDQISNDADHIDEQLEMDPAQTVGLHVCCSDEISTPNSISNWLQCQEVLYDNHNTRESVEGIICGKWRRAPLSEVQTNDWDCSCAVCWDPFHSDCAVPQELETDQVLVQLKYIERLRSRLAAKKRKLESNR